MILSTLLTGGAALSTVAMWKPKRFRKATQKLLLAPSKPALSQRKQQLREISGGENKISDDEKDLNRKIKIFAVSFSIASAAALVNPMLGLIGMPVTFYIVKDVFAGSYRSLKKKKLNVDTLVALLMSLMLARGHFLLCNYYLVLYLVNRKLNFKLKHNSSNQIVDVFKQQPKSVWLLRDGVEIEVPFESIEQDDTVVVSAGEKIPVDGIIIQGQATVDQHLLTGESQPVEKEVRDEVFALTIVLTGRIQVRVERAGTETTVAQIGDILNRTVDSKTDVQRRSERFTDGTVGPTFLLSGAVWPVLGPTSAMIVMNSHFRYRMNIITAASVLNFLNLAAQQGVLIKDGRALEALKKVDTVVFDKTGTLTLDQPHVANIHAAAEYSADAILALAAAAEAKQSHPIAKAICEEAKAYQLDLPQMDEAEYQLGFGLSVVMNGHTIRVGSIRFMQQSNCKIDTTLQIMADHCLEQGNSVVMVAKDDEVIGAIELEATIRPEASQVIESIRELQGAEIHVISGDQEAPTRNLAEKLKIDHY
ncbi:MAG: HAD-IC family P-type ATPase, partial [Thiolinea sp.]